MKIISLIILSAMSLALSGCVFHKTAKQAVVQTPVYSGTAQTVPIAPATSAGLAVQSVQITPTAQMQTSVSYTTNGMSGGVPCVFINKTPSNIAVTAIQGGCTFTLDLKAKTEKTWDIIPGQYNYTYEVGDDPTSYPASGPAAFTVDKEASHFYDGLGSFHGGIIFRGKP